MKCIIFNVMGFIKRNFISVTFCLVICGLLVFIIQDKILMQIRLYNLRNPNPNIREESLFFLGANDQIKYVVPNIISLLDDPNWSVQEKAILALNTVGSPAKASLIQCFFSEEPRIICSALRACGLPDFRYPRMFSFEDDQEFFNFVVHFNNHPDENVRKNALESLVWISIGAKEENKAYKILVEHLTDESFLVRKTTPLAIARLVKLTSTPFDRLKIVQELIRFLDKNNGINTEIHDAIDKINMLK